MSRLSNGLRAVAAWSEAREDMIKSFRSKALDQLFDGRRRYVLAGEHDVMRERGEFRARLRKHPSGFLRRGVMIDDALNVGIA
jgi:hypothetical protein